MGKSMKFLDFFSGIGGFRLGMEMAGHECLGHVEIDKYANKSYAAMHLPKESEYFATDIRTVEPGDLPDADCYCFGFPCQSFSIAGNRGGFEDTRGSLFFEVMRLAAVRKPKYLFAENVAGLLSHDGGKTFGTILNTLGQLGYWFEYQVLNSKNLGVPHNRERVFIVGHLGRYSGGEVFPIGNSNGKINELQGQQNIANCLTARYRAEGTGSYIIEREQHAQTVNIKDNVKQGYTEAFVGDGIRLDHINGTTGRGRVQKQISPTLTTSCQSGVLLPGFKLRRFTAKECFRLQGFPDEYFERAAQVNSDSQLYKQAGNSVTVNVIYEIAKSL
jgi:DNA (cytosine-5)-methyltransferase 1